MKGPLVSKPLTGCGGTGLRLASCKHLRPLPQERDVHDDKPEPIFHRSCWRLGRASKMSTDSIAMFRKSLGPELSKLAEHHMEHEYDRR
jgi:hypothetical protein